jgi:signal transduction histidine kinase
MIPQPSRNAADAPGDGLIEQFKAVAEAARLLASPGKAMDAVLHLFRQVVAHEAGVLFLCDDRSRALQAASVYGQFVDMAPSVAFAGGRGLSSWVAQAQRPVLLPRVQRRRERPDDRLRSFMSIPLKQGAVLVGVMNLGHSQPDAFTPRELDRAVAATEALVPLIVTLRSAQAAPDEPAGRRMEERIAAERLSAVRQTVVSLNHEINNPLSGLILSAELLTRSCGGQDERVQRQIETIKSQADRIAQFVKRLDLIQKVIVKDYIAGSVQMLDIERSILGEPAGRPEKTSRPARVDRPSVHAGGAASLSMEERTWH